MPPTFLAGPVAPHPFPMGVCGRKSLLIANRVEKWIFHRISILWLKFIHEALIRKSSTDVRSALSPSTSHFSQFYFYFFFCVFWVAPPHPRSTHHPLRLVTATFSVTFSFWACYELSQHILQHLRSARSGGATLEGKLFNLPIIIKY